jgi:hypothetical protein
MYLIPQTAVTNGKSTIRFGIKTSKTTQQIVTYDYAWSKNTWTHIAVTLSGDTAKMYINGNLVASNTNYTYRPSDLGITNNNYLGKGQLTSDPWLKGSIDEFKVYNRALSASEIATIASNSSSRLATVESPIVTKGEGLKVYPNPVKDQLTFQLPNDFRNGTMLKLMDVNGRIVYNKKISGVQYKLQADQLPSGTYFIQLNNGSRIITQKIVKK